MLETFGRSYGAGFSFARLTVGKFNRNAYDYARSLAAEGPPKGVGSLVISGGSGSGKTHLLSAIANELDRDEPELDRDFLFSTASHLITNLARMDRAERDNTVVEPAQLERTDSLRRSELAERL